MRDVGRYLGLAFVVPLSTLVGYGLGYGIDKLFHTVWIRWVFLFLGTAAGVFDLIRDVEEGEEGAGKGDKKK